MEGCSLSAGSGIPLGCALRQSLLPISQGHFTQDAHVHVQRALLRFALETPKRSLNPLLLILCFPVSTFR